MTRKATIVVSLVSESENIDSEQIEKEIMESLKCDWLAEVKKVKIKKQKHSRDKEK